ncbi:response regulator transcription factor [Massilia sp. IC2-278]|uniref:LuxR C-terminal-related transcriptional regulator n=1 Tax=Massilia sp. IC2-278 TaxID=2887200 RepID=UPI001E5CC34C|nr:response regulator transcription factor [Massilia sp. IC2-278]MCC2962098.1 response regulator transcription factor [Massilia sp. IC2-278]
MIGLLVAERNAVLRLGIQSSVASHRDITIVMEIFEQAQLLSGLSYLKFDVALVELTFFRSITSEQLDKLRELKPGLRLLVHSYSNDLSTAIEVFKCGALGYLARQCTAAELRHAIETIYSGKPHLNALIRDALAEHIFKPSNISNLLLSRREFQVFRMLAIGISEVGIAAQLNLSIKTVSTYKTRLLAKIGLSTLSDLVQYAIFHKLISPYKDWAGDHGSDSAEKN